jgi:multicomponent Na+:H+ antiporter subunit G
VSVASVLAIVLAATGAALVLLAAVGLVRMPDLFTRMQAASKASTLGAASILAAVAVRFGDLGIGVRAGLTCLFLFLTAPVAAHVIARAGYRSKVPMSPDSSVNDLEGRFDGSTGALRGLDGGDDS